MLWQCLSARTAFSSVACNVNWLFDSLSIVGPACRDSALVISSSLNSTLTCEFINYRLWTKDVRKSFVFCFSYSFPNIRIVFLIWYVYWPPDYAIVHQPFMTVGALVPMAICRTIRAHLVLFSMSFFCIFRYFYILVFSKYDIALSYFWSWFLYGFLFVFLPPFMFFFSLFSFRSHYLYILLKNHVSLLNVLFSHFLNFLIFEVLFWPSLSTFFIEDCVWVVLVVRVLIMTWILNNQLAFMNG